jgi:hypothetical protein
MKLRLKVSKKQINRASRLEETIVFAVIDLNKSNMYPANFVCMLPKELKSRNGALCTFMRTFGDEALQVAKRLLTETMKREDDADVKKEILKRLKTFEPKPAVEANCVVCGRKFQPRTYGQHLQRICQTCKQKESPF